MKSTFAATWIWKKQADYHVYNQTILARKRFRLGAIQGAVLRIVADSFYRLYVNGEWINDGPARSWPAHCQYDVIDVGAYLQPGENEILVLAKYYGVGDFHHVPQQAGLLCQLDITPVGGGIITIVSDRTWEVAEAAGWVRNTPKISIQSEPAELFDARLAARVRFGRAAELFAADKGPWKDLSPRVTALLTRRPVALRRYLGTNRVDALPCISWWIPVARLANPGLIEANFKAPHACLVATVVSSPKAQEIRIEVGMSASVNGVVGKECVYALKKGDNLLMCWIMSPGHSKEKVVRLFKGPDFTLRNPVRPDHENPWCFVRFPEADERIDDMQQLTSPAVNEKNRRLTDAVNARVEGIATVQDFQRRHGKDARCLPSAEMFVQDPHDEFFLQKLAGRADELVDEPAALMYDHAQRTSIQPSVTGDVQLSYDLGEQVCGYYEMDLVAPAGTIIDVFGIEYIRPDGVIQHTEGNRNGMRYIAKEGRNQFVSLVRRSGRYLFVTLRHMTGPVVFRKLGVIESTYPVHYRAAFACSDIRLDRIWEISERTLKLCMEDTFTDCPLYERTLWVGDARNEALYAYTTFGATDIARNFLAITGQSLERYYLTGCQVPSSMDCLLPAWSFMWGMAVWEYYFFSGDKAFLKQAWPWVLKNLRGAESKSHNQGLYSDYQWNMFDWGGIVDQSHMTVHNSMFIVGALDAALRCADALGAPGRERRWLREYRRRMVKAINRLWDGKKQAYPDAFDGNDQPVDHTCQHTSFLSLLYDIADAKIRPHAVRNMIDPPAEMGRVGSPFAIMFLYEALEKTGFHERILQSIYTSYLPMLDAGSTTVWEVFPSSQSRPAGFPTRSHCHGWSSAPLYFLPRVVLGIQQTRPGGATYDISPRPCGLTWASGRIVTARGILSVEWRLDGKTLTLRVGVPDGVVWRFVTNAALKGLKVNLERLPAPRG